MQYRTGFCAFCCPPPLFGALHTGLPPCFWLCRLIGRTAILSDGFRGGSRNLFWVAVLQAKKISWKILMVFLFPLSYSYLFLFFLPTKILYIYYIQSVYIYLLLYIVCIYILYIIILYACAREKYFVIQGSKLCSTTYFWPIFDFSIFML